MKTASHDAANFAGPSASRSHGKAAVHQMPGHGAPHTPNTDYSRRFQRKSPELPPKKSETALPLPTAPPQLQPPLN
jgi:hypothetical protein